MTLRRRLALTILLTALPLAAGVLWVRGEMQQRARESEVREYVLGFMQPMGRYLCEQHPESFPFPHSVLTTLGESEFGAFISPEGPFSISGAGGDHMPMKPEMFKEMLPPEARRMFPPEMLEKMRSGEAFPGGHHPPHAGLWAYRPDFTSAHPRAPAFPAGLRKALESGATTASEYVEENGREAIRVATRMPWAEGPCAIMIATRPLADRAGAHGAVTWGLVALCMGVLLAVLLAAGPIVGRIRRLSSGVREAARSRYEHPVPVEGSDELSALAREFNEAGAEVRQHMADVEAREETLRTFVADTTHDVMTPLTVLQGHLAAMRDAQTSGDPVDAEQVRASLQEAHYMASLVHNLSAVAKLEASAYEVAQDRVDLNALVSRVVERHRPMARLREIVLEYGAPAAPVAVRGDVTLLEQAVSNVVHNAVRYNGDGGQVSILLERIDDERFRLQVLDDGPGVVPDQLAKLTERRFRSEQARTRDPNGMGLGLHIAGQVAARHDFDLDLSAGEEGGLRVTFEGACLPRG